MATDLPAANTKNSDQEKAANENTGGLLHTERDGEDREGLREERECLLVTYTENIQDHDKAQQSETPGQKQNAVAFGSHVAGKVLLWSAAVLSQIRPGLLGNTDGVLLGSSGCSSRSNLAKKSNWR